LQDDSKNKQQEDNSIYVVALGKQKFTVISLLKFQNLTSKSTPDIKICKRPKGLVESN